MLVGYFCVCVRKREASPIAVYGLSLHKESSRKEKADTYIGNFILPHVGSSVITQSGLTVIPKMSEENPIQETKLSGGVFWMNGPIQTII